MDESDYDGIDLDWEYPDTRLEVDGFERLVRRFRTDSTRSANGRVGTMELTMAASSNPGTLRWLRTDFLLETMDWINVMTYDYAGDWTDYAGHHSPLFASSRQPGEAERSTEATMRYLVEERGMPAEPPGSGHPALRQGVRRRRAVCVHEERPEGSHPAGQLCEPPPAP